MTDPKICAHCGQEVPLDAGRWAVMTKDGKRLYACTMAHKMLIEKACESHNDVDYMRVVTETADAVAKKRGFTVSDLPEHE